MAYFIGLVTGAFWGEATGFAHTVTGPHYCDEHRAMLVVTLTDLLPPMQMAKMMLGKPRGNA